MKKLSELLWIEGEEFYSAMEQMFPELKDKDYRLEIPNYLVANKIPHIKVILYTEKLT